MRQGMPSAPLLEPSQKAFEQRLHEPKAPRIENPDGTFSTHEMASAEVDGKYVAYPTIVQGEDGKLKRLGQKTALDHAMRTGEFRQFGSDAEARKYAEGGYKKGTLLDETPLKMDAPAKTDRFGVALPQDISREAMKQAFPGFEKREQEAEKKEAEYADSWGKLTLPEVQDIRTKEIPDQLRNLRGMEQVFLADQKELEFAKTDLDGLLKPIQTSKPYLFKSQEPDKNPTVKGAKPADPGARQEPAAKVDGPVVI